MGSSVHPAEFHAIGIDVGGTKIAAGWVVFPEGAIRARQVIPTRSSRGGGPVLEDVLELAHRLKDEARAAGAAIRAVGLGLCELVDAAGGICSANCVPWTDQPVRKQLSALAPLTMEADVRAGALAEAIFGAGRGLRCFLYLTIGTGIASCLVIDGQPYVGARGATGTMASMPLDLPCECCGHAAQRTLEQIASGPALFQRYDQLRPGKVADAQDVVRLAAKGDPDAMDIVRAGSEALGGTVGLLVNVLDPEAIVVGGGLGLSEGPYWEGLTASVRRHIWAEVHRGLPILRARTGPDAGLLGAAAAAWKERTGG
jgi:glucokinase